MPKAAMIEKLIQVLQEEGRHSLEWLVAAELGP